MLRWFLPILSALLGESFVESSLELEGPPVDIAVGSGIEGDG